MRQHEKIVKYLCTSSFPITLILLSFSDGKALVTGCNVGGFQWSLNCIFEIIIFCFVVAICDLVHDVETVFHRSYVLTASGNLF